jgi:DNA-binding transcriptional MerR regulator
MGGGSNVGNGEDSSSRTDGLPIHQVSDLLGVPAPTLRSWERRYGLPLAARSAGGHRRYSLVDLDQLRLMRDEVARGRAAADAAASVRALLRQPATEHVADFLAASRRMDPDALRTALDAAHDELGLVRQP